MPGGNDLPERVRGEASFSLRSCPLVQLLVDRPAFHASARLTDRVGIGNQQLESLEAVGRQEEGGSAAPVGAGPDVTAVVRTAAGDAEVAGRARGECAGLDIDRPELLAVVVGLFEVVADMNAISFARGT